MRKSRVSGPDALAVIGRDQFWDGEFAFRQFWHENGNGELPVNLDFPNHPDQLSV